MAQRSTTECRPKQTLTSFIYHSFMFGQHLCALCFILKLYFHQNYFVNVYIILSSSPFMNIQPCENYDLVKYICDTT